MKKVLYFILVVSMVASLCSCGLFRSADESPASEGVGKDNTVETNGTGTAASSPVTENKNDTPKVEPTKVSFVGCGDNIIYYGNIRDAMGKSDKGRTYGFKYSYDHVKDIIAGADVSFINQETLMCGDGYELSYYPTFNSPQDLGYDLTELGFDVVNIANNHMLDQSGAGLEKTIGFWKEQPVLMIGGYESEEDYNTPRYLEKNGLKIAFLSYTYGTNGFTIGNGYNAWIPYLYKSAKNLEIDTEAIKKQTAAAKAEADVLIVSVHWGEEGAFKPNNSQKECAQLFADCGVDVIVGHHPHVIQPVEWLEGSDGNKTLCVYSLGNFMAEQAYDYNMVGGMISFDMVRSENGDVTIENPLFTPTVFHHNASFYNNQVWLMEEYTAEMAASHGISYYGNHTTLDKLKKYATDTISPEFLPDFLK